MQNIEFKHKLIDFKRYLLLEKFPNFGMAKTYNIDSMVPDSAATAFAIMSGNPESDLFLNKVIKMLVYPAVKPVQATMIL